MHITGRQTAAQLALTLRARAVRECLRHHARLRLMLQPVIADGARRVQPLLEIARFDQRRVVTLSARRPNACEAIRLQLDAHRPHSPARARAASRRFHLVHDAEHVLHVMPDLVRDHIRLRKVAARAEAVAQRVIELKIDKTLRSAG